jgi:glycosyltransferase involved in cell wall biosynthesis
MAELSILIPARNEEWLSETVNDLLKNIEADTEILVGLDGQWAEPGIVDDDRVKILYVPESIGQRAMQNRLAKMSSAKYVAKVDAHCAFDKGFDRKLLEGHRRRHDHRARDA